MERDQAAQLEHLIADAAWLCEHSAALCRHSDVARAHAAEALLRSQALRNRRTVLLAVLAPRPADGLFGQPPRTFRQASNGTRQKRGFA